MAAKRIGAGIALVTAMGAATDVVVGILHLTPTVGAAVIGIVIGATVACVALSSAPNATKRN